jgi:hypothetical protein
MVLAHLQHLPYATTEKLMYNGSKAPLHWPELMRRVSNFDAEHSCCLAF